jgi:hypothetical protein
LLNDAANGVSAARIAPVRGNIRTLGEAIAAIGEVAHVLYQLHPELAPAWWSQPNPHPGVSRAYGELLLRASALEEEGDFAGAIVLYTRFVETAPPEMFRQKAEAEINRLREAASGQSEREPEQVRAAQHDDEV